MIQGKNLLRFGSAITLTLCTTFLSCIAAAAQVPGSFAPSVYGEPATGPLPLSINYSETLPFLKRKSLELKEQLEQSRRPYLANIFSYTNEPIDTFDNKVDTITNGVEFGFYPTRQTKVELDFLPTIFGLHEPRIYGHEYRATVRAQPTDRLRYFTSLGLFHTFHNVNSGLAVIGGSGVSYALTDRIRVSTEYRRDIIGDSRMSAVGRNIPYTDVLVGRVKRNRWSFGTDLRPFTKTEVNFRYSLGFDKGHNVKANPWQEFSLRAAQTLVAKEPGHLLQLLQASYQFIATGFKYDESGFGNTTSEVTYDPKKNVERINNIISSIARGELEVPRGKNEKRPLIGGYFSPQLFYSNSFRLDMAGKITKSPFYYKLGGSLGTQDLKNLGQNLGHPGILATSNASLSWRMGRHVTVEQGWYFLQASNNYQRNVIYNQTRYYF